MLSVFAKNKKLLTRSFSYLQLPSYLRNVDGATWNRLSAHVREKDAKLANAGLKKANTASDDYELNAIDLEATIRIKVNEKDLKSGHLFENQAMKDARPSVVGDLGPRAVAVFNLPHDYTEAQVKSMFKGTRTENIHVKTNTKGLTSHAILEFYEEAHAAQFAKQTKGKWEGINLLRIETTRAAGKESFDQRTVVVGNIPSIATMDELENKFASFGNILRIEMPQKDALMEKELEKNSAYRQKVQREEDALFKERADLLDKYFVEGNAQVEYEHTLESISKIHERYPTRGEAESSLMARLVNYEKSVKSANSQNSLAQQESKTGLNGLDALVQDKRVKAFAISQGLAQEFSMVEDAQLGVENLKDELANFLSSGQTAYQTSPDSQNTYITPNQILNLQKYLTTNTQDLPGDLVANLSKEIQTTEINQKSTTGKDAYSEVQLKMDKELAYTLDWLTQALEIRAKVVRSRIRHMGKVHGKDAQVLYNKKDFANEPEDIDFFDKHRDTLYLEDVISINEQINNNLKHRARTDVDDIKEREDMKMPEKNYDAFSEDRVDVAVGSERILMHATPYLYDWYETDFDLTKIREEGFENSYGEKFMNDIEARILQVREELDLPFDQLYHQEKGIVDKVAQLEADLTQAKENADPLQELYGLSAEELMAIDEELYASDIEALTGTTSSGLFSDETKPIDPALQDYADIAHRAAKQAVKENLGYAFVTYSHSDESKKALILSEEQFWGSNQLDLWIKGEMDHGDFDLEYVQGRMKADAKLLTIEENLREAKADMQDFETNFEKHMPALRRLNEFKEAARDVLGEEAGLDRSKFKRTPQEEKIMQAKLKALEKKTGIEYSSLFASIADERANVAQHKEDYDLYKSFSFLKARGEEKVEKPSDAAYPWPLNQDTVSSLVHPESMRVDFMDKGEAGPKYGRRRLYDQEAYLRERYGADGLRVPDFNEGNRGLYKFEESIRTLYPMEDYSETAALLKQREEFTLDQHNLLTSEKDLPIEVQQSNKMGLNAILGENFDIDEEIGLTTRDVTDEFLENPKNDDLPEYKQRAIWADLLRDQNKKQRWSPEESMTNKAKGDTLAEHIEKLTPLEKARLSKQFIKGKLAEEISQQPERFENLSNERGVNEPFEEALNIKRREATLKAKVEVSQKILSNKDERDTDLYSNHINEELFDDPFRLDQLDQARKGIEYKHRDENERFLYRTKYQKGGDIAFEQTPEYMIINEVHGENQERFDSKFGTMKNQFKFSDRDIGTEFRDSLEDGAIGLGMDKREAKIQDVKDLSLKEISQVQDEYKQKLKAKPTKAELLKQLAKDRLAAKNPRKTFRELNETEAATTAYSFQDEFEAKPEEYRKLKMREILAKLEAGKLTNAEFDQLFPGNEFNQRTRTNALKDYENRRYISHMDRQTMYEEELEIMRRQAIMDGKCTTQNSIEWLNEKIASEKDDLVLYHTMSKEISKILREDPEAIERMLHFSSKNQEYYFDENQGVTLEEHIKTLKMTPNIRVETRQDDNGNTIVRKTIDGDFSIDADTLINFDLEKKLKRISKNAERYAESEKVSEEDVLSFFRDDSANEFLRDPQTATKIFDMFKEFIRGDISDFALERKIDSFIGDAEASQSQIQELFDNINREMNADLVSNSSQYIQDLAIQTKKKLLDRKFNHKLEESDLVKQKRPEEELFNQMRSSFDKREEDLKIQILQAEEAKKWNSRYEEMTKSAKMNHLTTKIKGEMDRSQFAEVQKEIMNVRKHKKQLLKHGLRDYARL